MVFRGALQLVRLTPVFLYSLVEAPNVEKKPNVKKLTKMLTDANDIKERNKQIVKAYVQGYSQHMIAKY